VPQRQADRYSLYIHPGKATITTNDFDELLDFLTKLGYEPSIRLTLTQGFFVRDLKEKDVQSLLPITAEFSSIFNLENTVACVGPTICNFGINNSQELLNSILETFKEASDELKAALPRILISGCPNSCAQHQKGLIGFTGRKKRTENGVIPTYSMSFNGKVGPGVARFGDVYGDIPAEKIANLLVDLANLKINSGYTCFTEFTKDKDAEVRALVAAYSV
jgi:sulfite reductase (ferredoxin)